MFNYVLKRIGYLFLVLLILSIVIFMIYNLTPSNRACIPMRITPTLARKASSMASCRATSAIPISTKKM